MSYKFTNTNKSIQSKGLLFDSNNSFKLGNYVFPTYDPCESATVPLTGTISLDDDEEVEFMAASDGNWITLVVQRGIYWYQFCRRDLKECLSDASEISNYGEPLETMVCYAYTGFGSERFLRKVRMYQVPRIFTWKDINPFILETLETLDIEGAIFNTDFIRLANGKILCRQNNEMYQEAVVEQGSDGEVIATMPQWLFRHRPVFCLFKETENGVYEYEQGGLIFDIEEARRAIGEKIFYDNEKNISIEQVYNALLGMVLTVEDSYAVGNCRTGTESFIDRHGIKLKDGQLVVNEKNRDDLWEIALNERQFMRVLKKKTL